LANHSVFKCATLLFEGFRSSLGCAWVLLPGFIGFCWILGGTSKQQNPPPCPFRLGSKTVHGFTFKFRPVIVPLRWITRTHLLRLISTISIVSACLLQTYCRIWSLNLNQFCFVVETVDVEEKLSSSLKLLYNIYVVYLWLTPYGSTLGLDARQERICLCLFQSWVFRLCGHTQPTCFNKCFSHCGGSQACPVGNDCKQTNEWGLFKKIIIINNRK